MKINIHYSTLITVLLKLGFHLLNDRGMIFSVPNCSGLHIPISFTIVVILYINV